MNPWANLCTRRLTLRVLQIAVIAVIAFLVLPAFSREKSIPLEILKGDEHRKPLPNPSPSPLGPTPESTPEEAKTPSPTASIQKIEIPVNLNGKDPDSWGDEQVPPPAKSPVNITLTLLSLAVVCLLAYATIRYGGKYLGNPILTGGRKRMITVLERQTIGANKQICILEVPGKIVLVGITEKEITVLCELDREKVEALRESNACTPAPQSLTVNYLNEVFFSRWQGGK